nr:unnamed protein product [Callosobruchus chinensis]CAH7742545.1 unnamed protein product [Callosobruchus chinensis]CAH7765045.1 unnamed protein product [Callosobruchus chinensis]
MFYLDIHIRVGPLCPFLPALGLWVDVYIFPFDAWLAFFIIRLSRFLAGSSENSSNEGSGTDSDSDAPLSNWLPSPSTSAAQSGLADNDNDGAPNVLSLISGQSSSLKGPEIHSDVSSLLTGFLLNIVDKESRAATIASYPCIANCAALRPPEINPEIRACLDANALKQDNFLQTLQR